MQNARNDDVMYAVRMAKMVLVDVCDIVPTESGKTLVFRVEIGYPCEVSRHTYGFELDGRGNVCPGSEYIKNTPGYQHHHELALKAAQECFTGRIDLLTVKLHHCGNFRAVRSDSSAWNWMFRFIKPRIELVRAA